MIDWTQVIVALITGLPVLLTALVTLIVTLRTQAETVLLKEHVNSKMDQLLAATTTAAGLEGEKRGRLAAEDKMSP